MNAITKSNMAQKLLNWPKVYFFGDSLTQFAFSKDGGWGSIIASELQRKADVVARGFSGYNTRQCKALLPYLEDDIKNATVVGIFLGANDANDPVKNPQQAVPLDEYERNLKDIVSYFKTKSDAQSLFLITPPALDEEKWSAVCVENERPASNSFSLAAQYAKACKSIAHEIGIPCVDIHTAMIETKPENADKTWKDYLSDGLHFSSLGSELVASKILPVTLKSLNDSKFASHDVIMPLWGEINIKDPNQSFNQWIESLE